MKLDKYDIAGLSLGMIGIGLIAGIFIGGETSKRQYNPTSAYVLELNGDERPDLVLKSNSGFRFYLVQQKDGTYKNLDRIQESQRESIEEKVRGIKMWEK